jgi:hypothetical protein
MPRESSRALPEGTLTARRDWKARCWARRCSAAGLPEPGPHTKQAPARNSPARQTSGYDVVVFLHVGDLVARGAASRRMPQRSSSPLVRLPGDQHLTRLLTPEGTKTLGIRRKQLGEALFDETVCARVVVRRQPLPLQR